MCLIKYSMQYSLDPRSKLMHKTLTEKQISTPENETVTMRGERRRCCLGLGLESCSLCVWVCFAAP